MTRYEQQVRERAYHIWEGEGRVFGRAVDHWLRAEAEFVATARAEPARAESEAVLPLTVQPPAAATSDAPSPVKVLKTRSTRTTGAAARAVSAKADAAGKAASAGTTTDAKPAAKAKAAKASKATPRGNAASRAALPSASLPNASLPSASLH